LTPPVKLLQYGARVAHELRGLAYRLALVLAPLAFGSELALVATYVSNAFDLHHLLDRVLSPTAGVFRMFVNEVSTTLYLFHVELAHELQMFDSLSFLPRMLRRSIHCPVERLPRAELAAAWGTDQE